MGDVEFTKIHSEEYASITGIAELWNGWVLDLNKFQIVNDIESLRVEWK